MTRPVSEAGLPRRRTVTEAIRRMEAFDCTKCGAAPGTSCRKPSGVATVPHRVRYERAVNAGRLPLKESDPL